MKGHCIVEGLTQDPVENKIIEVVWVDACADEGNIPLDVASQLTPLRRFTVGYVVKETDSHIVLGFGLIKNLYNHKNACEMPLAIPRSMITSMREL